jgi:hypothetical protein
MPAAAHNAQRAADCNTRSTIIHALAQRALLCANVASSLMVALLLLLLLLPLRAERRTRRRCLHHTTRTRSGPRTTAHAADSHDTHAHAIAVRRVTSCACAGGCGGSSRPLLLRQKLRRTLLAPLSLNAPHRSNQTIPRCSTSYKDCVC